MFNENEIQNEESNEIKLDSNKIDDADLDVSGGKVFKINNKYYPTIDAIGGFANEKDAIEIDKLINDAMPKPGANPMTRPNGRPMQKPGGRPRFNIKNKRRRGR